MEVVNIEQEELDEYDVFEVKNILKFNWINRLGCVEALATGVQIMAVNMTEHSRLFVYGNFV